MLADLRTLLLDDAPPTDLGFFAPLLGSWRLAWTGRRPGDDPTPISGELAFAPVLGGRAVQDVWVVPGHGEQGYDRGPRAFHGTTIRMPDPERGGWRSVWIDPLHARVRVFRGTETDAGLDLVSDHEQPWLRWCFRDVTRERFRWTGEYSGDDGATWLPEDEMIATRTA